MSLDHDPLLRAVADGDTACPDGRALSAIGRLTRDAAAMPRTIDLIPGVLARLDAGPAYAEDDLSDEAIDAFYDGNAEHPTLDRMASLIRRAAAPAAVDLTHAVRGQLAGSASPRREPTIDLSSRFRVWSAVVAAHVAAVLVIAAWQGQGQAPDAFAESAATVAHGSTGDHGNVGTRTRTLSQPAPAWQHLAQTGRDLYAPRRNAAARDQARLAAGLAPTAPAVATALRWLIEQQDDHGHFGTVTGADARDLATQSLAVLALLGEGIDDPARAAAAQRGLRWLADHPPTGAGYDSTAISLSTLAQIEGAALFGDEALRRASERALADLEAALPTQPGPNGLGGIAWLTLETAKTTGLTVSGRALAGSWRKLADVLPPADSSDAGRLGLAAFGRLISDRHHLASTDRLLSRLAEPALRPQLDAQGRSDPLGTCFATWAMSQAGGAAWRLWCLDLTRTYLPLIEYGPAHPASVRFAEWMPNGSVFATAAIVMQLQAPYRTTLQ